jgi:hypothetical protein
MATYDGSVTKDRYHRRTRGNGTHRQDARAALEFACLGERQANANEAPRLGKHLMAFAPAYCSRLYRRPFPRELALKPRGTNLHE